MAKIYFPHGRHRIRHKRHWYWWAGNLLSIGIAKNHTMRMVKSPHRWKLAILHKWSGATVKNWALDKQKIGKNILIYVRMMNINHCFFFADLVKFLSSPIMIRQGILSAVSLRMCHHCWLQGLDRNRLMRA